MSDYLWDKSGDPEPEIERLEELLGNLRHRPRTLELPAEAVPLEPRRLRLFGTSRLFGMPQRAEALRRFGPARVAVAAMLLLMFLSAAAIFLRTRMTKGDDRAATRDARQSQPQAATPGDSVSTNGETVRVEKMADAGVKRDEKVSVERDTVKDFSPGGRPGVRLASFPKQPQKLSTATANEARAFERGAVEAMSAANRGPAPALFESTRLLAKEQLVYALRLTGSKLRQVRRKTQGLEDSKPGSDAPGRIK